MSFFVRKIFNLILIFILLFTGGCSDNDPAQSTIATNKKVILVSPIGGFGDAGYNDLIMRGVMQAYKSAGFQLSIIYPSEEEEVRRLIEEFCVVEVDSPHLLFLADSNYSVFLPRHCSLPENKKILVSDVSRENVPEGITSFSISRAGVYYLAGRMASPHCSATIIAAMPGDQRLEEAISSFQEGFGKEVEVVYLDEDEKGYNSPEKAYKKMGEIDNSFVIPLAGGSNNGIYKYSREQDFWLSLVAGADIDCQKLSPRVPFSVVIHIDRIVKDLLMEWISSGFRESHYTFGLTNSGTEIIISDVFSTWSNIWEDYYLENDYWEEAKYKYFDEAIRKDLL